jgi:hypothetical protein
MLPSDKTSENWNNISLHPPLLKNQSGLNPCWSGINLFWYQQVLLLALLRKINYQSGTDISLNTDFGQVYAWYIDWYMQLIWDWYYLESLLAGTGIKLVPDLGHTILVWYLIPMFIPVLISVFDPTYQNNTGLNILGLFLGQVLFFKTTVNTRSHMWSIW